MYFINLKDSSVEKIQTDMLKELGIQRGEVLQLGQSIFVVDADNITRVLRADIDLLDDNEYVDDAHQSIMNQPMSSQITVIQNSDNLEFDQMHQREFSSEFD